MPEGNLYWTIFGCRDDTGERELVNPWQGEICQSFRGARFLQDIDDDSRKLYIPHPNSENYLLFATYELAEAEWIRQETLNLEELKEEHARRSTALSARIAATGQQGNKMSVKYTEHGDEVEVLSEFDGGFVVQYFYEDEDRYGQQVHRYSEPTIVKQLFDAPPSTRRAADLSDLESQVKQKREELQVVTAEIKQAKAANKELLDVLARNEALANLKDFIDGKVTHYVTTCPYDGIRIASITEFHEEKHSRLLSLFGQSNGLLTWRVNRYRDDSGGWSECWPCCSHEEALAVAQREIESLYCDVKRNMHQITRSAEAIGLVIPKHISLECASYRLDRADAAYKEALSKADKARDDYAAVLYLVEGLKHSDGQA